jgi:hypothetical protein
MSVASLRRRVVAALLGVSLLAVLAPSALAKSSGTFLVTACEDSTSINITVTWSGITADDASFGAGSHGGGLGALLDPFAPLSSGTLSQTFPIDPSDPYTSAGASLYLGGLARANIVASKTLHRGSGWPTC